MQNLYFDQEELKNFQTYVWEVVQVWMKNKPIDRNRYRDVIMTIIKDGNTHKTNIIQTIKIKQNELLDKSFYFKNNIGK